MKRFMSLLLVLVCTACGPNPTPNRLATDPVIAEGIKTVKADKKVLDFLYEPAVREEWNIGVLPTAADLNSLADYYCALLETKKAVGPKTRVRIVDVKKVYKGDAYRKATLGYVECQTHEVIQP